MPEAYLKDLFKRYQEAPEGGLIPDVHRLFGGPKTRPDIAREAQGIAPILNLGLAHEREKRGQETEARKAEASQLDSVRQFVKMFVETTDKYHGLDEHTQTQVRPMFETLFQKANKSSGFGLDPAHISKGFTERDFARTAASVLDPVLSDEERQHFQQRFAMTPPANHGAVATEASAFVDKKAAALVRDLLPVIAGRVGATDKTPRAAAELIAAFRKDYPGLAKSPALIREVQTFLTDDKNAGLLAQAGVLSPKASAAGQVAKETELAQLDPGVTKGKAEQAGAVTTATEKAKEGTPQGQATLAKTRVETKRIQQDIDTGKVVPYPEGGGVAAVKPGKVEVLQPPGPKPPGERTRGTLADLGTLSTEASSLLTRAQAGGASFFGMASRGVAGARRAGEQVGLGQADPSYESFWSDMDFTRAKYIKAMEDGNVSKSDMEFFLSSWPKRDTAPTAAVENMRSAVKYADNKLAGLQKEFRPQQQPKVRRYNPKTDRIE